jgi:hypothetical protein
MPWRIVERRIGRAGGVKQREGRQREWDRQYGEDAWMIGYVVDGAFVSQDDAIETIYAQSYADHFAGHPEDLAELVRTAKVLRNPHALATTGVDLQVPAIMAYLRRQGIALQGTEVMDIGSYGQRSHALSVRLSPVTIKASVDPTMTLEKFWQTRKCLAVWEDGPEGETGGDDPGTHPWRRDAPR